MPLQRLWNLITCPFFEGCLLHSQFFMHTAWEESILQVNKKLPSLINRFYNWILKAMTRSTQHVFIPTHNSTWAPSTLLHKCENNITMPNFWPCPAVRRLPSWSRSTPSSPPTNMNVCHGNEQQADNLKVLLLLNSNNIFAYSIPCDGWVWEQGLSTKITRSVHILASSFCHNTPYPPSPICYDLYQFPLNFDGNHTEVHYYVQGGVRIEKKRPGVDFLFPLTLGGLTNYVIRHTSIYGNIMSSVALLPRSWADSLHILHPSSASTSTCGKTLFCFNHPKSPDFSGSTSAAMATWSATECCNISWWICRSHKQACTTCHDVQNYSPAGSTEPPMHADGST